MKNILKQFVEWVMPSNQSEYKKATVILTIYYTLSVVLVLVVFNLLVYFLFNSNFQESRDEYVEHSLRSESEDREGKYNEEWAEEVQESFTGILLTSDLIIIFLTLIMAYVLAQKTLTPLEESHKKQIRFTADAAHELRTPLAVMQAGGEVVLRSDRSVDEYKKFISESLDEVKRLTTLSNNLLFLARNDKKKVNLIIKNSFTDICRKQVEAMRPYASKKNIVIADSISDSVFVLGDGDDLIRMIVNLLKNAVDYSHKDGEIEVSLKKQNNKAILVIKDFGVGIKESDLGRIFERFYKADDSRTLNSTSTGLGLAIVLEIVKEHKGTIKVDSVLGKETTFTVVLPCI